MALRYNHFYNLDLVSPAVMLVLKMSIYSID